MIPPCVCGICKSCLKRLEPTEEKRGMEKNNKRIQQEINVLLITVKTIYDKANFAPLHKNEHEIAVSHEGNCVL